MICDKSNPNCPARLGSPFSTLFVNLVCCVVRPTTTCLFQQAITYTCETLQSGAIFNKVHFGLSSLESSHDTPRLEHCNIQKHKHYTVDKHNRNSSYIADTSAASWTHHNLKQRINWVQQPIKCTVLCLPQKTSTVLHG